MRNTFKAVIERGNYDLTVLLNNIDRYHIEGKLSATDREALYALARQQAAPQYNVSQEIEKLWAAIRALQNPDQDDNPDVPQFVQPTGAHNAYSLGDQVIYQDKRYTCMIDNCVWSPNVMPDAWLLVEE